MSAEQQSGSAMPDPATVASTATIVVPPRPDLPPGWTVASARTTPESRNQRALTGRQRSAFVWPRVLLAAYLFVLTLIALWPVPVDSGAGPALRLLGRVFPVITHARVEFGANILLFVPLGILLALILRQRHLVVPIAFLATVTIESMQALMIDRRVPSLMDIVANVAGACLGLVIVAFVEWWRGRRG